MNTGKDKKDARFRTRLGGARQQISVGIALITVIPILSLYYLAFVEAQEKGRPIASFVIVGLVLMILIGLGYYLLSRYPASIIRLRRQLDDMVESELPEDAVERSTGDDISAIEESLNLIVNRFSTQVERVEGELSRIGWLLSRDVPSALVGVTDEREASADVAAGDEHVIFDALGTDVLADIVGDFLDLVETTAFVYETDGVLAFRRPVSQWCRLFEGKQTGDDETRTKTCSRLCEDGAWRHAAQVCIRSGRPEDVQVPCGLRLYAAPIRASDRIVGAVGFAYGDPPRDTATLTALAHKHGLDIGKVRDASGAYETRPLFIVSLARNRLLVSARLMGVMVERKQAEEILRNREEELRKHRDHLGELVEDRTAELKRTNERLAKEVDERRRAEDLKDEFVSTVSHELRTPLAITKEGVSLLMDGVAGGLSDRQMKVLTTARANIDRLQNIINDLLDISKIEAGKLKIQRRRADLCEVVSQAVGPIQSMVDKKGLALQVLVPQSPVEAYVDPLRITQVFTNLVHNAIKFTHEGTITVALEASEGEVVCFVRDTGIGIAEDDLPKLFHKFTQIGRRHGAGTKGTGLGLTISKRIVELHRGRMRVESQLGQGTTFHFTLPILDAEGALRERIDDMLEDACAEQATLTLFVYQVIFGPDLSDAQRATAFEEGVRRLVDERMGVRMSDFVGARATGQIVLLAPVEEKQVPLVCRRWQQVIQAGFSGEEGRSVESRSAFARFPADGSTAHELLTEADRRLNVSSDDSESGRETAEETHAAN